MTTVRTVQILGALLTVDDLVDNVGGGDGVQGVTRLRDHLRTLHQTLLPVERVAVGVLVYTDNKWHMSYGMLEKQMAHELWHVGETNDT